MDCFTQLVEEFSNMPHVKEWSELQAVFRRAADAKPKHWLLPLRVCESVGGGCVSTGFRQARSSTTARARRAMLAVACAHIGIILVDDMLDDDPRGAHVKAGMAGTANMASALQAAAGLALSRCAEPVEAETEWTPRAKLRALESLNEIFLATALGQHWDADTVVEDEETYWRIARAKSSPFFSGAFELGALAGGAPLELANQIKELGILYGEMIQIHDDLDDTLAVPAKPDWKAGRVSLPILFAQVVDHPARSRFRELRPHACDQPSALEEAQEILIRCGAVSYCIHQLTLRDEAAREKISALPLECRDAMEKIFRDVIEPVLRLLEEA